MDIKRAKQEIKDAVEAYLLKNAFGEYEIPAVRQRPVLLMGPPGIGKTQIMEQIAKELKIGLVAYTITHHTRQSAVGLPFIREKEYGGQKYSVTEYTMSEIIASVYEKMEQTGMKEGILFIDEINCVSETLAPAMLQFLQGKTFGTHRVPEGWIIVAAGNPPEYNKSVREFDVVTLDRLKKIDVEADFPVWKEYAYRQGIHPAVISYLELRREINRVQKELDAMRRRNGELSTLFKRLYEDNVLGRVTNEQFRMLSADYNEEQKELESDIPAKEDQLERLKASVANVDAFIEKAKQFTAIDELTPQLLRLFIQRIEIGERSKKHSRSAGQSVRIVYRDIGALDMPMREGDHAPRMTKEITEKEAIIRLLA